MKIIERWINKLNPKISKAKWNDKEGRKLFKLHKKHGSKWKFISKEFSGRTDNYLKNQFFSLVRRSLRRIIKYLKTPKRKSTPNLIIIKEVIDVIKFRPKMLSYICEMISFKSGKVTFQKKQMSIEDLVTYFAFKRCAKVQIEPLI